MVTIVTCRGQNFKILLVWGSNFSIISRIKVRFVGDPHFIFEGSKLFLAGQNYRKFVRGGLLYGPLELMKTPLWAGVDSEPALH